VPNTNSNALQGILSTKWTSVPRVLSDLNFANLLSQRGTISCTIFSNNTNFLGATTLLTPNAIEKKKEERD
jgi:hypothetical protein